jgi:hypothetical protein
MSDITIKLTEQQTSTPVTAIFSQNDIISDVLFEKSGKVFSLNDENLSDDPSLTLAAMAQFVGINETTRLAILNIGELTDYKLIICGGGSYVQITLGDDEVVYWDDEEFQDDPCEVIGSLCGALCGADRGTLTTILQNNQ